MINEQQEYESILLKSKIERKISNTSTTSHSSIYSDPSSVNSSISQASLIHTNKQNQNPDVNIQKNLTQNQNYLLPKIKFFIETDASIIPEDHYKHSCCRQINNQKPKKSNKTVQLKTGNQIEQLKAPNKHLDPPKVQLTTEDNEQSNSLNYVSDWVNDSRICTESNDKDESLNLRKSPDLKESSPNSYPNDTNINKWKLDVQHPRDLCGSFDKIIKPDIRSKSDIILQKTSEQPCNNTQEKSSSFTILLSLSSTPTSCNLVNNLDTKLNNQSNSFCSICDEHNRLSNCLSSSVISLPEYLNKKLDTDTNIEMKIPQEIKKSNGCELVQNLYLNASHSQHDISKADLLHKPRFTSKLSKLFNLNSRHKHNNHDKNYQHNDYYSIDEKAQNSIVNNDTTSITSSNIHKRINNGKNIDDIQNIQRKQKLFVKINRIAKRNSKSTSELDKLKCRRISKTLFKNTESKSKKSLLPSLEDVNDEDTASNNKNSKSRATNIARDIRVKTMNLLKRRHTESSYLDKTILPSKEDLIKWQTSFEHILRHKYGVTLFTEFLKTEFSVENIEFWLACEDYKNTDNDAKKLSSKAKKIFLEFLQFNSPKEINLDTEIRHITENNLENPSLETFDRAQKRIQALMEKDSYPRFLLSDLFKDLYKVVYRNDIDGTS